MSHLVWYTIPNNWCQKKSELTWFFVCSSDFHSIHETSHGMSRPSSGIPLLQGHFRPGGTYSELEMCVFIRFDQFLAQLWFVITKLKPKLLKMFSNSLAPFFSYPSNQLSIISALDSLNLYKFMYGVNENEIHIILKNLIFFSAS